MKKAPFLMALFLSFAIEILLCVIMTDRVLVRSDLVSQDTVSVNEVLRSVEKNFGNPELYEKPLPFAVLDPEGELLYESESGVSHSMNEAVRNRDTILDVTDSEGRVIGRVLICNRTGTVIRAFRIRLLILIAGFSLLQLLIILIWYYYLKKNVLDPFRELNRFAERVASGNLDLPLPMDRRHVFGSFSESFDLMRSELKKARAAEKKAYDEKKEMTAKLSHDIKTPIASIKSASEIGCELAEGERVRALFAQIDAKTDQVTLLVDNLFEASVGDVTEISVTSMPVFASAIMPLLQNADFRNSGTGAEALSKEPYSDLRVYVDMLRLQQAFDNIFMNSYKYADTKIDISFEVQEDLLWIRIRDQGPGVSEEELPLLTEKYRRGSNASGLDGAGLGLYLTAYYLDRMNGILRITNAEPGLMVSLGLRIVE